MWLASFSLRKLGFQVASEHYTPDEIVDAEKQLLRVLRGVGDKSRQKFSRHVGSFSIQRACTEAEINGLPRSFHQAGWGYFGGPIEVLWHTGFELLPSSLPCVSPGRIQSPANPHLWYPEDCGECGPCLARLELLAVKANELPA